MDSVYCIEQFYSFCTKELTSFEIWPGYYKRRYKEFKKFYQLFPRKALDNVLEIGCGIGYQSVFLSCMSKNVEATDVDFGGMKKHSRGIALTQNFVQASGKTNIRISTADAQHLPFDDGSFDLVYCSYSFQYVPDKQRAFSEIKRVLKKDGHFFCVLPISPDRLSAAIEYYPGILKKLLKLDRSTVPQQNVETASSATSIKKIALKKLLPPPDDDTNTYVGEIFERLPYRWMELFRRNDWQIATTFYTAGNIQNGHPPSSLQRLIDSLHSTGIVIVGHNP